jgi:hypothetical protein
LQTEYCTLAHAAKQAVNSREKDLPHKPLNRRVDDCNAQDALLLWQRQPLTSAVFFDFSSLHMLLLLTAEQMISLPLSDAAVDML